MIDNIRIGAHIRFHRESVGLTQKQVADMLHISYQAISAWERDISLPDLENVIKMAELFGTTVDSLISVEPRTLFVGIDGGGSKTEFVLFQDDGTVCNVVRLEGSNPNDAGMEPCLDVLSRGLTRLLQKDIPKHIFAGIAGCSIPENQKAILDMLHRRYGSGVSVDSDAANVLSCGKDPENVIAIICGTGSCVFTRKNGIRKRIGGWGYLFDQAGSAYDIGKDAIRCTLAVEDGLIEDNLVAKKLHEILGESCFNCISAIHKKGRSYIASLSRYAVEAAESGDTCAMDILRTNADRLATLIQRATSQYYSPPQIIAAGGFWNQKLFLHMVEEKVGCQFYIPACPPVYGACIEAMRQSDRPIEPGFYDNFMNSYRRFIC